MEKEYFVLYTPQEMNKAYSLLSETITDEEITNLLINGDDIDRQAALLHLNKISSKQQADILLSLLTGQHGPVREICSAKINEFLRTEDMRKYFYGDKTLQILLNSLNDIIPTVVRNILEVIRFLPEKKVFCDLLLDRILALRDCQEEMEVLSNHEITKRTFKLYWYMEALAEITGETEDLSKLEQIIEFTYQDENYTIREKAAKILAGIDGFERYKEVLSKDKNPYVFFYFK
ncbi:MAG: hypothetical protein K6C94_03015 [Candidatus Gastranaerophilales bacterium]|nr:hypothetical protein [Candidatus Gastranaerophilales bacterium]